MLNNTLSILAVSNFTKKSGMGIPHKSLRVNGEEDKLQLKGSKIILHLLMLKSNLSAK